MQVVFVGGIHGSGKSTFCREFAPQVGAQHLSAGELIRAEAQCPQTSDKEVSDVELNQRLLIAALRRRSVEGPVVLDGHYTLVRGRGVFERVSVDVFSAIAPCAFIYLTAEPMVLAARLLRRDGRVYSAALLAEHDQAELSGAKSVSFTLGTPLFTVQSSQRTQVPGTLVEAIRSILEIGNEDPT